MSDKAESLELIEAGLTESRRRIGDLEKTISTYRTAVLVAGTIFTVVLGWSAKSSFDAVRSSLDPTIAANEKATVLLEGMQSKRDQLDVSIASMLETRDAEFREAAQARLGELDGGLNKARGSVAEISDNLTRSTELRESISQAAIGAEQEARRIAAIMPLDLVNVQVLENRHNNGDGKYFYFEIGPLKAEFDRISNNGAANFNILNQRSGTAGQVVVWNNNNNAKGHSAGNAHARFSDRTTTSGDWQIGDVVVFLLAKRR